MKRAQREVFRVAVAAVMMCLFVILNRFVSVYIPIGGLPTVRVGFSSIPIVLASLFCGPVWGALAGAGGDLIGAFAFPNGSGAYLYGYTIDQALLGIIPWILYKLFKNRRKLLLAFDFLVTMGGLGLLYGLVLPESEVSGKYRIPLDTGGRVGLGVGLTALVIVVNVLTWILSQQVFGSSKDLDDGVLERVRVLSKSMSYRELAKKVRADSKKLINLDISTCIEYSIKDISESRKIGWKLYLTSISTHSLRASLEDTGRCSYSFLDIYSILLFEMVTVKTALLAFWGQLYYSIPYAYGVFGDLIAGIVTLPILAVITYTVIVPLYRSGLLEKLDRVQSYRK